MIRLSHFIEQATLPLLLLLVVLAFGPAFPAAVDGLANASVAISKGKAK